MKKSTFCTGLGLLLIAAALCLTLYNIRDSRRAAMATENALQQLALQRQTEPIPEELQDLQPEMPVKIVDGHDYVGVVQLPTLGLTLPVLSEWSYPNLKLAPCRFAGSVYSDNLVIAAHNYHAHFGQIKNLHIGDTLTFTDMAGHTFSYQVMAIETLQPTAVEELVSGDGDLTLFTCTIGGQSRVTVRCERI